MKSITTGFLFVLAVDFLVVFFLVSPCFAITVDEASGALSRAESDLNAAYAAVANAADSGADVRLLFDELNVAGGFLSEAYAAYRAGDEETAFSSALACSDVLDGVAGEAASLESSARRAQDDSALLAVVGSAVGLVMLIALGFFGWGLLEESYSRRVLKLRPVMEESL